MTEFSTHCHDDSFVTSYLSIYPAQISLLSFVLGEITVLRHPYIMIPKVFFIHFCVDEDLKAVLHKIFQETYICNEMVTTRKLLVRCQTENSYFVFFAQKSYARAKSY